MESLAKSDIFFFITSVVVIVIGVAVSVIVIYVIRILRDVKEISKEVKDETKQIIGDVSTFRKGVKDAAPVGRVAKFISQLFLKRRKGRK